MEAEPLPTRPGRALLKRERLSQHRFEGGEAPAPTSTRLLDDVIVTRPPVPTATPGVIQQEVAKVVARAGLARTRVLGLAETDWFSLVGSLLLVLIGYLIGTWLIRRVLVRIVRRTPTEFDDRFLAAVGNDVRWLVVLLTLHFDSVRLTFVSAGLKTFLKDAYFVVGLVLTVKTNRLQDSISRIRKISRFRHNGVKDVGTKLRLKVPRNITSVI